MLRTLLAAVLVIGCSAGVPQSPSPGPSAPGSAQPTAPPTAIPTPPPTTAPATGPTAAGTAYCNPDYDDCDKYTPSPAPGGGTGGSDVVIATSADGSFLTNPDGFSLYTFDQDSPGASTCDGGCADSWPPLTVQVGQAAVGAEGVAGELATIERADGSLQVTYDGWPLYFFAGDTAPGDTNGDGVGGVWHLATP
jgi:predicted lipoprotein with Yx(FWY)xxD motif